jgi:hypothetical protein
MRIPSGGGGFGLWVILFFLDAIAESNSRDYVGQQLGAVEGAPTLGGGFNQLEYP